jgi:hypothetical protein
MRWLTTVTTNAGIYFEHCVSVEKMLRLRFACPQAAPRPPESQVKRNLKHPSLNYSNAD